MTTFQDRLGDLRAESQRFADYIGSLPPEAWNAQSACDRWQVGDVVAHLVGVAEFYAGTVERGVDGSLDVPQGRAPAGSQTGASAAEGIHQRTLAARQDMGDQVLPTLVAKSDHLIEVLASLKPEDHEKPCYHPGGYVPAGNFVDMRFKELGLHDWDIRSRLDSEYALSPASMPSMVILIKNSFASGSIPWAFWPGPSLDTPVRYRFDVSDPVELKADVVVDGDRVRLEESGQGAADVTCRCDTETFLLLAYGRLAPKDAIASGKLSAQGDDSLIGQLSEWFKGI